MSKVVYCFTGMPLAGKTTAVRRFAKARGLSTFSTGDFARARGMGMEDSIRERDLSAALDGEITEAALAAARSGLVLDGFPRSLSQVDALRVAGIKFRVVFITENPLIIYDRLRLRSEEQGRPEDVPDVVAGRLKASTAFMFDLQRFLMPGELTVLRSPDAAALDSL